MVFSFLQHQQSVSLKGCGVFENKNATRQIRMVTAFAGFVANVAFLKPHPLYTFFSATILKIPQKLKIILAGKIYSIIDYIKSRHKRHIYLLTLVITGLKAVANFFDRN